VATGRVVGLGQGFDPLSGEGLGESDAVAAGLAEVGVVEEPVDGGGGQGLGHELVESGGVQIRGDRDAAAFVGGIDESVESFGGVGSHGQQPDVINDDEVGAQDPADGLGDRVVSAVTAHQHPEGFEGEPGDVAAGFDGGLAEGFEQEGLAGARGAADHQVLRPADSFQGA
jgi:hypothetical protein